MILGSSEPMNMIAEVGQRIRCVERSGVIDKIDDRHAKAAFASTLVSRCARFIQSATSAALFGNRSGA